MLNQTVALRLIAALTLAGTLTACPKDPKNPPTIVSFTASSTSVPFGGGDVTLSWIQADATSLDLTTVGNVTGRTSAIAHITATTTFTLNASNKKGTTQAFVTVTVQEPTQAPTISGFTASPSNLGIFGGQATLLFSVNDAKSLFIDNGVGNVTGKSQAQVNITQTTTYTLTASNQLGTVTAQTTVTVYVPDNKPTVNSFTVSPANLPIQGGAATLSWNVTDATSIAIDNGVGVVTNKTSANVNVTQTTTYTLTATNVRGQTFATTTLTVYVPANKPTVNSFTVTPANLPIQGGSATLNWNVTDATALSIDNGVGVVTGKTSQNVSVTQTTTYTLTATNVKGQTFASTTLTVYVPANKPVVNSFTASPSSLGINGGQATLSWNTTDATAISIDHGVGLVTGQTSRTVNVTETTTFTLSATNVKGTTDAFTTVTVYVPPTKPIVTSFSSNPTNLPLFGGSATLSWNVIDATGLSIDNGVGNVTGQTSKTINNITQTTTYTLTATNVRGATLATTTVTVYVPPAPPTISSFTANPSTLPAGGGTVSLSWLTTDAQTLVIDNGVGNVLNKTSINVSVAVTTAFKIIATNVKGTTQQIVLVTVNNPTTAPQIGSFTATPGSVPSGGGWVQLNWNVNGATSSSIDNGIGNVQGLSTKQVWVSGQSTFTLTATNSVGSSFASTTVVQSGGGGGGGRTINGKALYGNYNLPAANVTVDVLGVGTTTTDSSGNFTLTNVPNTYDLAVVAANGNATLYKSLTRQSPTVLLYEEQPFANESGEIWGKVTTSGGSNVAVGSLVIAGGAQIAANGVSSDSFSEYDFLNGLDWFGNAASATLFGFESFGTSSPRVGKSTAVSLGSGVVVRDFSIATTSAITLSGNCNKPSSWYSLEGKEVGVKLSPRAGIFLPDSSPSASFNLYAVSVSGGDTYASCSATDGAATTYARSGGYASSSFSVSLNLQEAPSLSQPLDGASNVGTGTTFSWSQFQNGVHVVRLKPRSGTTGPSVAIVTSASSLTFPELDQLSTSLPSWGSYAWSVDAYAPLASVDDAANGNTFSDLVTGYGSFKKATSASRNMTLGN